MRQDECRETGCKASFSGVLVHNENTGVYDIQFGTQVLTRLDAWGNPILAGQITNDDNWRNNYNQTFNDLLQINAINTNLSQAQRDTVAAQISQIQLTSTLYTPTQLANPNNPVNQQIQQVKLQIKLSQAAAGIIAEPKFSFIPTIGDSGENLNSAKSDINHIVNNIKNDSTLSDSDKNNQINNWKNLSHQIEIIQLGQGLYNAGLQTSIVVAGVVGTVVAGTIGAQAIGTIALLSQTPAGQKILGDMLIYAANQELTAATSDPVMQSIYGEVLKQENGTEKALGIALGNTLLRNIGELASVSSSTLKPATDLVGTITNNSGRTISSSERALGEIYASEGYAVEYLPENTTGGRNADTMLTDLSTNQSFTVEFKALDSGATSRQVMRSVEYSLKQEGQSPFITIDARSSGLTIEEAQRSFGRIAGILPQHKAELKQVRIIGDGFDITGRY